MTLGKTQGAEVGSRGDGDGKYEENGLGEKIFVGYSGAYFGGSRDRYPLLECYPLVELLGVYGLA